MAWNLLLMVLGEIVWRSEWLYVLRVPDTGWVVYFWGLGVALSNLTQISARHRSTGARSTGLFLWWNFLALKKNRCRKTTASYDLILFKIPGYVSYFLSGYRLFLSCF
jgi:hypothetical protein